MKASTRQGYFEGNARNLCSKKENPTFAVRESITMQSNPGVVYYLQCDQLEELVTLAGQ
jgi:hypothetical protein